MYVDLVNVGTQKCHSFVLYYVAVSDTIIIFGNLLDADCIFLYLGCHFYYWDIIVRFIHPMSINISGRSNLFMLKL